MQDCWRRAYATHALTAAFARQRARAERTITEFLSRAARPYVAFSGGKDSLACLLLVRDIGRTDVPVFTQGDDLDWPEKRAFCECTVANLGFRDYTYALSAVSALTQLESALSVHGTFSHVVRAYVHNRHRDGVVLGLRAQESRGRRILRAAHGPLFRTRAGQWRCMPIADWMGIDVFALIVSTGTPYFHLYDRDDACAPHELRMSWLLNPDFLDRGAGTFLRRHYPEHFNRLARVQPALKWFT